MGSHRYLEQLAKIFTLSRTLRGQGVVESGRGRGLSDHPGKREVERDLPRSNGDVGFEIMSPVLVCRVLDIPNPQRSQALKLSAIPSHLDRTLV